MRTVPLSRSLLRTLVMGLGTSLLLLSSPGCSDSGPVTFDLILPIDAPVSGDAVVNPDTPVTPDVPVNDVVVPPDTTPPPDAPGPDVSTGTQVPPDTSQEGLLAFANAGEYLGWLAEPEVHPSAGPHGGGVRIFFNDAVAASLAAGNQVHPAGSVIVKELWGDQRAKIQGFAIDVKIADGEGPDTWLFMEYFPPKGYDFYGVANPVCTGCHASGVDYVRVGLP